MNTLTKSIGTYFKQIYVIQRSLFHALKTALPYVFGVGEERKEVTEDYPDPVSSRTEEDLPPRTRGILWNDVEKCTGCGDCVPVCPAQCISFEGESISQHKKLWIQKYDIDLSRCVFCGLCVQACHPKSLVHTKRFEAATFSVEELNQRFGRGVFRG